MAMRSMIRSVILAPRCQTLIGIRAISGKSTRQKEPKPAPATRNFEYWHNIWDKTTYRFDENTKLINVEGAHAVGKSKFCQELAEELEMAYWPQPSMERICTNSYGVNFKQFNDLFECDINKIYDEIDFARNPTGPVEGFCDRFMYILYAEKLNQYFNALKHIFNTGQGVVLEGSPYCHYAFFEACYNQGWITRETRAAFKMSQEYVLRHLLRPNLIIYLDAPTDVVLKKIKDRGNEWDKDSPVWTNKRLLEDTYNEMKRNFLKKEQDRSYVLVYDWSQPGDMEVVLEDIEALEFDYLDQYDIQQGEWKMDGEPQFTNARYKYCNQTESALHYNQIGRAREHFYAPLLWKNTPEVHDYLRVLKWIKSERYAPGFNLNMGDSVWDLIFKWNSADSLSRENRCFHHQLGSRVKWLFTKDEPGM